MEYWNDGKRNVEPCLRQAGWGVVELFRRGKVRIMNFECYKLKINFDFSGEAEP